MEQLNTKKQELNYTTIFNYNRVNAMNYINYVLVFKKTLNQLVNILLDCELSPKRMNFTIHLTELWIRLLTVVTQTIA